MWHLNKDHLCRSFEFKNFIEAFGFLTQVALLSEVSQHHPTIINTYNKVELRFTTHDAGNQVTEKDYDMAARIDKLVPVS